MSLLAFILQPELETSEIIKRFFRSPKYSRPANLWVASLQMKIVPVELENEPTGQGLQERIEEAPAG